jgi:thiamine monophosphate synthase
VFLLAITPGTGFDPGRWRPVLQSGVDAFLIREKSLSTRTLLGAARWARQEAPPGVSIWVADRLDVALVAGCGVHGSEHYPEQVPGLTPWSRPLHSEQQWQDRCGADQLLISPVFDTPGKGAPWGVARLHRFLDQVPPGGPRLLALGGVGPAQVLTLGHPRLDGVAAIRPFWQADPRRAVEAFRAR